MSFHYIINTYSQNYNIMELYDIIELLNEALDDNDWELVETCKEKLEEAYDLNDGSLDKYFDSQD